MVRAGEHAGLRVAAEVFADRAYDDGGNLVARSLPGAVITGAQSCAQRAVRMVLDGGIDSINGNRIALRADSVCVHGDTPGAAAAARAVRTALEAAGVELVPLTALLA
jgi:UPF0271 protein